jgi:hypothetical protein
MTNKEAILKWWNKFNNSNNNFYFNILPNEQYSLLIKVNREFLYNYPDMTFEFSSQNIEKFWNMYVDFLIYESDLDEETVLRVINE